MWDDKEELLSAARVILDVAASLVPLHAGRAKEALQTLIYKWEEHRLSERFQTYLACFSLDRDMPYQWTHYGAQGQGLPKHVMDSQRGR